MMASEVAAWWGAILATLVFFWDVYKWTTTGARLKVKVAANMVKLGAGGRDLIVLTIQNRGDRRTTVTLIAFVTCKSKFHRMFRRMLARFTIFEPTSGDCLPKTVHPGEQWVVPTPQQEILQASPVGLLCVAIAHSESDREIWVPVRWKTENADSA